MGPWRLAWRRLRRNRVRPGRLVVFVVIVACCLAAPLYAEPRGGARPEPDSGHRPGQVDGRDGDVVTPDGTPIGPGLRTQYLLGADPLGRDVMVRLLYGGRNSLVVGFMLRRDHHRPGGVARARRRLLPGRSDRVITSVFDILWSFPVLLFAIALGTALAIGGLNFSALYNIDGGSIWIPIFIIGVVYVPYLGRPVRGQVLSLREKEFVEAAVAQGMGSARIMFGGDPAQPHVDAARVRHAHHRQQHPARDGAVLPRRGHPAARRRRGAT